MRALRAMADANTRRAQYEAACTRLTEEVDRSSYLREQYLRLADELRRRVAEVAGGERAAGHTAVQMVLVLHDVVDEAGLDRATRRAVEATVVEYGIDSYYAA